MNRTYDKFQVVLLSEVKGKDSNAFIFELRLTSEDNCRIRIIDFDAFDIDGNKYSAGADKISTTDVILGHSKFFAETKKINVKISSQFKARIGCMAVLTVACIEDKQQMKFCFQRKGTNRWDCVGVEFMEYEGLPAAEEEPVETEGTLESVEELTDKAEKQVQAQTEAQTQTGASAVKEDGEEQAAVVVQDSPAEDIPAAQDEKAAAESLEEYLEREGAESVLGLSMKEFVNRFALGTQTVEDVLKQLNVNVAQEEEPAETISQPAPVSQPEEEEQEQQHQVRAVEILQMELFQQLVKELKALAERAAVGLRSAAVRRGRRCIPRRLPWGRLAMRRRRSAWLLLRDAGVNALIVAQITIVHGYSSRVVRNTLARWMSLASCAARATLSRRLSRRKGCSA